MGVQHAAEAAKKLDVVRPFNDQQDRQMGGRRWGKRLSRPAKTVGQPAPQERPEIHGVLLGLRIVLSGQLPFQAGHGPLMALQRMEGAPQFHHPAVEACPLLLQARLLAFPPGTVARIDGRRSMGPQNAAARRGHG
jgi:hypothetical protein